MLTEASVDGESADAAATFVEPSDRSAGQPSSDQVPHGAEPGVPEQRGPSDGAPPDVDAPPPARRLFRGANPTSADRERVDPLGAVRPRGARSPQPARVVVHRPTRDGGLPPATPDRDYTAVAPARLPQEEQHRRPLLPVLIAAVLAVALVAVVVMALISALSDDGDEVAGADPRVSAQPSGAQSGAASAAPVPTGTPSAASSGGAIGSGSAVPGLVAAATVVGGDLLEVTEEVSWPDGGPVEIRLGLPDLTAISGLPAGLAPAVTDLQVSVNGNPVEPVAGIVPNTWLVRPVDVGVPKTMSLRYLVSGVLIRSTPSQPGRALAVIAPLSQPELQGLPTQIKLAGSGVLNLACAGVVDATAALCAQKDGDTWTAVPPDGSPAVVVAQLDLPPPA